MKKIKLLLISGFLLVSIQSFTQAQERKNEFSLSAGYTTRVINTDFDGNASGLILSINFYKHKAIGLTTDAQVSINYISENQLLSDILSVSALYGVRYYFNPSESNTRVFVNTVVGPALNVEQGDDFTETLIDIGYSAGIYIAPKQWLLGISFDNPGVLSFKVGYRL